MPRSSPSFAAWSSLALAFVVVLAVDSFTATSPSPVRRYQRALLSTPFDLDMYDDVDEADLDLDANSNPFRFEGEEGNEVESQSRPLGVRDPTTRLVLGINKYSHDASVCAADASTGRVLFASSKERITRRKHDGGNVASLVEHCLDALDMGVEDVAKVVMNNHHHRILPFAESHVEKMEWEEGLGINGGKEAGYADEYNLLTTAGQRMEVSHHLAHAYSAAAQCPFHTGMVVVMDGMGDTWRTMNRAKDQRDKTYHSDIAADQGTIQFVPSDIQERAKTSHYDWREAESVYTFTKEKGKYLTIKPVFKRFSEENTPPALYNHGFADMDSLGAVYSRASSHVFGDWNACGKVMGLAPWQGHEWDGADGRVSPAVVEEPVLEGALYDEGDGGLRISRRSMTGLPLVARTDPDMFDEEGNMVRAKRYDFDDNNHVAPPESDDGEDGAAEAASSKQLPTKVALDAIGLASRVQADLETVAMDFVGHFKRETGEANLCLAGGVALNSVLNGRLSRELGFENTFVPPYPGDDGIAVGCCAFGLFGRDGDGPPRDGDGGTAAASPPLWNETLSPYLGAMPTDADIREAIAWASPWLDAELVRDDGARDGTIADEIASGGVVAVCRGRSEMGPRALGHRSILADPRKKALVRFVNEKVKGRESFRPFAPSCLAEEAGAWFELGDAAAARGDDVSPYMSITAQVRESRRDAIPAVTHVDGSSRLQTVTPEADPAYHRLISAFFERTGVPMVLNTSFNTLKGEPIVETPRDAIRSFLSSMGAIEMLVLGDYVIRRKEANVRTLLGEERKDGTMTPPSFPKRAGAVAYQTTFSAGLDDDDPLSGTSKTLVQMSGRPMHNEMDGGWLELLDDLEGQLLGVCDGTVGVSDIMTQFAAISEEENYDKITDADQFLLENILQRLVRLQEHTLISW